MSVPLTIIERQTIVAPLGLRFRDAATGAQVRGGLVVNAYPTANPSRRTRAFDTGAGTYVVRGAASLRAFEFGAGDRGFWDAVESQRVPFTVEVFDEERRYLPYSFETRLPLRGLHTWKWPLAEATARPTPEPAALFADDFADGARAREWKLGTLASPPTAFDPNVSVVEQNQRLEITPLSNVDDKHFGGYVSVNGWNLTDASASVKLAQTTTGAAQTLFTLAHDANNSLRFSTESSRLNFQTRVAGMEVSTSVTFDANEHGFWRLRHELSSDRLFFETSGDGATWTEQRSVPRQFPITGLTVELNAGTTSSVASPGKAVFEEFRMEANPTAALPLYAAPTRPTGGGLAVLRADLWDATADAPAAWALMEARVGGRVVRGYSDERGRVALVFPYPEPERPAEQSPPQAAAPFTRQEWVVQLFASYAPRRPVPTLPDLDATLRQPRATLWADAARTTPLAQAALRAGRELVVRSAGASTDSSNTPLAVLLITPAGSPP